MTNIDRTDIIVNYIVSRINPDFVFLVDNLEDEAIFDVAYYSSEKVSEYDKYVMENEMGEMLEFEVELNNLRECDIDFASGILADGEQVYCKSQASYDDFVRHIARNIEKQYVDRSVMITRLRECGCIYEQ